MSRLRTKKVIGSPEQEAFWYELLNGENHIMLEARAGTGKTFSCIEGCRRYVRGNPRASIAIVAYNKNIASELAVQVPQEVTACTMHSLGFKAIRDYIDGKVKVNNWKTINILEEILGKKELRKLGKGFQYSMKKVVSLAKNVMVSQDNFDEDFDSMVAHYNLQLNGDENRIKELLPRVLDKSLPPIEGATEIDFDDMIWLPVVMGMPLQKFDMLFIDEAQDLNKSRQLLAIQSLASEGRLIAVGDPKQAIYGFAGADAYSMSNLAKELRSDVTQLPLTVSRRCPKKHIKLAQKIVSDILPMDDAIEGTILHMPLSKGTTLMEGGDLVLCRMNAPLVKLSYQLIKIDTPVTIQGRDIGANLVSLCKKLVTDDLSVGMQQFHSLLGDYHIKEIMRLDAKALHAHVSEVQYASLTDRVECLRTLMQNDSKGTALDVVNRIENLFSDNTEVGSSNKVLLSSVHRAKGLEAHTVFIVEPDKMPHPMATLDWEIAQEFNIKYVAITRSMDTLVFLGDE